MELLYWHWIVFGVGLVLVELIIPSFTALWFGLGAAFVGLLLLLVPELGLTAQISCWAIVSTALTIIWFKILRPPHTLGENVALNEVEGEKGLVISKPSDNRPGRVRFSTPLKGYDEWDFRSEDKLDAGDQIQVTGISDNILIMKKFN